MNIYGKAFSTAEKISYWFVKVDISLLAASPELGICQYYEFILVH